MAKIKEEIIKEKIIKEEIIKEQPEEVIQQEVNEQPEEVIKEEPVIDLPPHVVIEKEPKKVKTIKEIKKGEVHNCLLLRIREGANLRTKEIKQIKVGDIVKVDLNNSTETFYEVTHDGTIGFCLKDYIKLV